MSENKDWSGNKNSVFKTLGASNHTDKERENDDFYATSPTAAEMLLELETLNKNIWEHPVVVRVIYRKCSLEKDIT